MQSVPAAFFLLPLLTASRFRIRSGMLIDVTQSGMAGESSAPDIPLDGAFAAPGFCNSYAVAKKGRWGRYWTS